MPSSTPPATAATKPTSTSVSVTQVSLTTMSRASQPASTTALNGGSRYRRTPSAATPYSHNSANAPQKTMASIQRFICLLLLSVFTIVGAHAPTPAAQRLPGESATHVLLVYFLLVLALITACGGGTTKCLKWY